MASSFLRFSFLGLQCGALVRFLETVGLALDGNGLGVMHEAVHQRFDTGGIGGTPRTSRQIACSFVVIKVLFDS